MTRAIFVLFFCSTSLAQTFPSSLRAPSSLRKPSGVASGGGTITVGTTGAALCAGGATGASTTSTTTVGNFVGVHVAHSNGLSFTITDNKSNTYACNTPSPGTGVQNPDGVLCYAKNATTGAGHVITVTASGGGFPGFCAATFQNVSTASPFDKESTPVTSGTGATLAAPSTMPTANGSLILFGCGHSSQAFVSFDSGFTVAGNEAFAGGSNYSSDLGYLIQTTAAAVAPTCTIAGADTINVELSVFK